MVSHPLRTVLRVLLAVTCPVCAARGAAPCRGCAEQLRPPPALPAPREVDELLALLSYEGVGRELVARLKYANHRAALGGLARAMAALIADPASADAVTWAPTTPERRQARGFDHAELLAKAVARHLRLPCQGLLVRRPGPAQTGRTLAERRVGPDLRAVRFSPRRVVVVDDVATSGATLTAAAFALRGAGAVVITALVAARTPPPSAVSSRPRSVT